MEPDFNLFLIVQYMNVKFICIKTKINVSLALNQPEFTVYVFMALLHSIILKVILKNQEGHA